MALCLAACSSSGGAGDGDGDAASSESAEETATSSSEAGDGDGDAETAGDGDGDGDGDGEVTVGDAMAPLGDMSPKPGGGVVHILDVQEHEGYLYAASYAGLYVIDVNDPGDPTLVQEMMAPGLYWVSEHEGSLLVQSRTSGARRFAIGANGMLTPEAMMPPAYSLEGAAMLGDYVYMAAQTEGLLVRNFSDLTEVAINGEPGNAFDVKAANGHLYVADRERGLMIFDLADPANPNLVGELELLGALQELAVEGEVVYAAASGDVYSIDVSDPANPVVLDSIKVGGIATRIDVDAGRAVVATWYDTRLYDVSDPADIQIVALEDATQNATAVDLVGDTLYVGDWDDLRNYSIDMSLSSTEISHDAALTVLGDTGSADFLIIMSNDGILDLQISDYQCADPALSISAPPEDVAPGLGKALTVTVDLDSAMPESLCTVSSNDVDEPETRFQVLVNPAGLNVGDPAPDFSVPDLQSTLYSLSDFQGEVLIVTIFSSL